MADETVASFAARWLDDFNRATRDGHPRWGEKTRRDMRYALSPFALTFATRTLRNLDPRAMRTWAAKQPTGYVTVARTMLGDAVKDGLADSNPLANLRLERSRGRRDIDVLTEEELEEAIEAAHARHGKYGSTFAAIVAVAGYTAIRPGELAALEAGDIDVENNEMNVVRSFNGVETKRPKNERQRYGIILPPQATRRLAVRPPYLRSPWLFTNTEGNQLRTGTLNTYWRDVAAAIGHEGMTFYALRHAGATLLLERGVEPEDVAWQMGHADDTLVRQLYGSPHRSEARRRERIKAAFA